MPLAQFSLMKRVGTSPGSESDTGWNPCFLNEDLVSTNHGSYPVQAPESGYEYSYENWLRLKCTQAPDNAVANIKAWYASVGPGTGLDIFVGTTASYATPTSDASSVATANATTYPDAGSALAWGTPQADDKITAINQYTDYLVTQLRVAAAVVQGDIATQILHVRWDES